MNKIELFKKIYAEHVKGDIWLDTVPTEISSIIFDNPYVESITRSNSILLETVFGAHAESIYWFMYEWKPGDEVAIGNYSAKIMGIDQYIDWMVANEGFSN